MANKGRRSSDVEAKVLRGCTGHGCGPAARRVKRIGCADPHRHDFSDPRQPSRVPARVARLPAATARASSDVPAAWQLPRDHVAAVGRRAGLRLGVRIPVRTQPQRVGAGCVAELRRQAAVSVVPDRVGHRYSPRRASTRWPARYSPIPIRTRIRGFLSPSSKCCVPASIRPAISARRFSPMRTTRSSPQSPMASRRAERSTDTFGRRSRCARRNSLGALGSRMSRTNTGFRRWLRAARSTARTYELFRDTLLVDAWRRATVANCCGNSISTDSSRPTMRNLPESRACSTSSPSRERLPT